MTVGWRGARSKSCRRAYRSLSVRSHPYRVGHDRDHIADLANKGHCSTVIAVSLGSSPSTISRELRRNVHESGQYRPFHAHSLAATIRRRGRRRCDQ